MSVATGQIIFNGGITAVDHGRKFNALSVRVLPFERVALDNRVTEVRE
jgi:hypothetical protein